MNIFDKRPLFLILTTLIGGFVIFTFSDGIMRGVLCGVAILFLSLSLIFYFKKKIKSALFIVLPIMLLVSILSSYVYFDLNFKLYEQYDEVVKIEGKVVYIEKNEYSTTLTVKTAKINEKRKNGYKIRLNVASIQVPERIAPGSNISFEALLCEFEDFSDIDANVYYFSDGISSNTNNVKNIKYIGEGTIPFSTVTERVREFICERAYSLSSEKTASLFSALFIGERDLLTSQVKLDFKRLGITHILALSGLHLTIISFGISGILSAVGIKKKSRLIAVGAFVIIYMLMTGLSVSIMRAGLMLIIHTALFLLGKTKDSLTSLSISVFLILLVTPYAVYDIALWLSALSTLGIITMTEIFDYEPNQSIPRRIAKAAITSLAASFFATSTTLLISSITFGTISLASAVATLVFSLLAEVIIYGGMLMLIFGKLIPFGLLLDRVADFTCYLAGVMAEPDWIYIDAKKTFILIATTIYTLCFAVFLIITIKNKKRAAGVLAIVFIILMVLSLAVNLAEANTEIAAYHVDDDGDRIIIRKGATTSLVCNIDHSISSAYESYSILSEYGITNLDNYYVANYSNGLIDDITKLLSLLKIKKICLPKPANQDESYLMENLGYDLEEYRVDVVTYDINTEVAIGEYKVVSLFRMPLGERNPKVALRLSSESTSYLYLSHGMMHEDEKIMAFEMIANSDATIFGRHGSNKYDTIVFNTFVAKTKVNKIIIGSNDFRFDLNVLSAYRNSGTKIYYYEEAIDLID